MKKFFMLILGLFCLSESATASYQQPTYAEEMYALGSIAGQGLACKSKRYHQFELLARAILVGKAPNAEVQKEVNRLLK